MNNEEGRNFKRYKTLSECEVSLKTGIYKGKVLDYSEGVSAIFENVPQLIPGTQANIKILDLEMDLKCEVVWVKKIDDNLSRVGFKRVDSFKGSLKNFKLADILLGLQKSTRTGILKIESGSIVKKIFIKSGDMIFATSNDENDRLGELLLKEGKITFEEYNRSANLCKKTKKKLGNIFVELGYLTPNELFREIRHQIEEIIFSLFAFEKGNFEFQEGPLPSEEFITLRISAANLIYQGIKRINNFLYIKQICPPIDAVLNLSSNPLNIFQDLALEYPDKKILSYINGMYSIRTILSLSPSKDFETLKTICAFLSIGLVKVKEENETPVEFSIKEILGEPDEEITAEFIETIEDMYNKCETLEYYEILGIEKEASPEEITKAYYRLSKQFHPDRHFSLPSYEIKGKLIKILFYITRAYKILSVPEKRKEYDRTLSLQASDLETQVADEVTAKVHGQMSDMKIVELKNKDELQAEVLRTAYDDTFVLEKDNVYMKEKKYKDISKNRNDVFKIEEEISETQLEEQKQPISELTTDTDTATGKEHDVLEEEIFKEKEIAKGDNGLKTVPEQTLDEEVEELKSSDEEPQLDVVKVAQDDVTSLETDRIKKKRLYTTIVTAVAVVSIMVLSVIYKNFNKTYQQPVPVVTKAVKEQRLPQLPPLRDELIRKLLSEVPEQQPQLPPLRDELISWGSR